jgi:hypothetical protein
MLVLFYISSSYKSYLKSEVRCNLSPPQSTSNVWISPKVDLASAHPDMCVIPHAWCRGGICFVSHRLPRADLALAHPDRYVTPHSWQGGQICCVTSEVAEGRSSLGPP